ncbi:MAG: hypothetical protein SGPRY_006862 [Prymnesium sp.]
MRAMASLAFLEGFMIVAVGICTIYSLQSYGNDIGSRFQLMNITTGHFAHHPPEQEGEGAHTSLPAKREGSENPQPTLPTTISRQVGGTPGSCGEMPWLPSGMSRYTALWRLDNLVVVPYHEELQAQGISHDPHAIHQKSQIGARTQTLQLIRKAQGSTAPTSGSASDQPSHPLCRDVARSEAAPWLDKIPGELLAPLAERSRSQPASRPNFSQMFNFWSASRLIEEHAAEVGSEEGRASDNQQNMGHSMRHESGIGAAQDAV